MSKINVDEFVDTPVIQKLKKKNEVKSEASAGADLPFGLPTKLASATDDKNETTEKTKSTRGRKRKYNTDEERIQARRAQQKAYRERKKKEFEELKARATKEESDKVSDE